MIVKYMWTTRTRVRVDSIPCVRMRGWQGWFLFGFLPLYIRCVALETT